MDRHVVPDAGRGPVVAVQGPSRRTSPSRWTCYVTVPKPLVVASNGRLLSRRADADEGWHTYHWRVSTPINNYGVALNIAPYRTLERSTSVRRGRHACPFTYWVLPENVERGRVLILEQFVEHLRFFEELFGPYPFRGGQVRRGRDAAPGDGAPDDHRLRQRLPRQQVGFRLVAPPRAGTRVVGQSGDRRGLGGLLAARGLRHLRAAPVRRAPCTAPRPIASAMADLRRFNNARAHRTGRPLVRRSRCTSSPTATARPTTTSTTREPGSCTRYAGWSVTRSSSGPCVAWPTPTPPSRRRRTAAPAASPPPRSSRGIVETESGLELDWLFDTYLRHASSAASFEHRVVSRSSRAAPGSWRTTRRRTSPSPCRSRSTWPVQAHTASSCPAAVAVLELGTGRPLRDRPRRLDPARAAASPR